MIEFLKRIFSQPSSSSTARERLRLVLMSDHLTLAPEMIEQMKSDLVDVISKYVEVDRSRIEVSFEEHDKALAMLANIPILSVNRPTGGSGGNGSRQSEVPAEASHVQQSQPAAAGPPRRKRRKKSPSSPTVKPAPAT